MVKMGESDLAHTPDAVKETIFLVLFSKNSYSTPGKRAFAALFPTVDTILRILKESDHTILPRLLQTLEAKLFLQVIGRRIDRKLPGVPITTVHDCVVVPASYADQVEAIMREELMAWVGLPPHIKREVWSTPLEPVSALHMHPEEARVA
jgi:hypothetical protein